MKLKKNSGMLYRYIVNNLLLLMIPFVLILCVWLRSQCSKEIQNYLELERGALNQTRGQIEAVLNDFERTAYQISIDRKMTSFVWNEGTYDSVLATEQLKYYLTGLDGFEELVVSFGGNEILFRTKGKTNFHTFSHTTYRMGGMLEEDRLYGLINGRRAYGFLSAEEYLYRSDQTYTIITHPIISAEQQYATLSGIMGYQYLKECLVEQTLASRTYICNKAGEVLFSNAGEISCISDSLLETAQTNSGITQYREDGKLYHVITLLSEETNLYYIRMVSQETLIEWQIQEMLPAVFIVVVIGVLVLLIFAIGLSFYHYMPIRNLLRMFDKDVDYKDKHDELLLLNDYIRNLQEKNKSLEQIIEERETEQVQSILIDILFGRYHLEEEDVLQLQHCGISIDNEEFAIMTLLCEVDDLENKILTERLQQISMKHLFWITQDPPNCFIFLYHAPAGTKSLIQQAKLMREMLLEKGYDFSIGISGYTDSIDKLQISLMEEILSLNHEKNAAVNVYNSEYEYEKKLQKVTVYPGKEELLLLFAIQKGDREQIFYTLDKMEAEFSSLIHYYQGDEIRFKLYRIIGFLAELPGVSEDNVGTYINKLVHYNDIAGFFMDFRECINNVQTESCQTREIKGISIQTILDFINEHFCSSDMSLTYVADYFDIRASYLSTFFKESTGVNFITYVQDKRMEHAKQLLAETELAVKQIAVGVGYSDIPPFIKKFSKKYGMSSGAYRKMICSGDGYSSEEKEEGI